MSRKKELREEAREVGTFIRLTLKTILLVAFILITLTLGFGIYRAVGAPPNIDHTFTSDLIGLDSNNFTNGEFNNLGNPYAYSDLYNASYSFTGETGQTGTNIGFVSTTTMDSVEVLADLDNHDEVLEMYDTSLGWKNMRHELYTHSSSGSVEFWWRVDEVADTISRLIFREASSTRFILWFTTANDIYYDDGASTYLCEYVPDVWYHFRFDYECGAGGYLGLGADEWRVFINGREYGDFSFKLPAVEIDAIYWDSKLANKKAYLDGVGFSHLSNYSLGDNFLGVYSENTTFLEPMNDEFRFEGINDLYESLDDNPNGWSDIEVGGGDSVNVRNLQLPSYKPAWERTIEVATSGASQRGIEKDFNEDGSIIGLDFSHKVMTFTLNAYINITIHSKDESDVVILILDADGNVEYLNDTYSTQTLRAYHLTKQIYYNFSFIIDYNHDICTLEIFNGTTQRVNFPLRITGKTGLGTIQYKSITPTGVALHYLDYIGASAEGEGLVEDLGFIAPQMSLTTDYNTNYQYLFNITEAVGNFSIYACATNSTEYVPDWGNEQEVWGYYEYLNESIFDNMEGGSSSTVINASIVLYFNCSSEFSITSLRLDGGHLQIGSTSVIFDFIYSDTIHSNTSYFWVDDSNRLNWYCEFSNDSFEAMRLVLNVPDFSTINRSILFYGYQDFEGNRGTTFGLNYVGDEQDNWRIRPDYRIYHYGLRQTTTINYYYLSVGGAYDLFNVSGYITSITFNYLPTYTELTITTLSLITVIIPLIIMLAPSLTFATKFGKNGFLLMFFFMSLICVITGLIPVWIFVIITIAYVLFLLQRKRGGMIGGL